MVVTGYTISAAQPAGLIFTGTTGTISGTPTTVSAATNYTITGWNVSGSSSTVVSIAVGISVAWTAGSNNAKKWAVAKGPTGLSTATLSPGINDAVSIGVSAYVGRKKRANNNHRRIGRFNNLWPNNGGNHTLTL